MCQAGTSFSLLRSACLTCDNCRRWMIWRSTRRWRSLGSVPAPRSPALKSPPAMPARLPRFVSGWMACRWRLNWLPPASVCCHQLALLARLSQRLAVLTSSGHTLPERQQTLRNTLKWSYDLLDAQEQKLFRLLSVFVGGWTVEAVETLWQANPEAGEPSALDGLASLLDKSLLVKI